MDGGRVNIAACSIGGARKALELRNRTLKRESSLVNSWQISNQYNLNC